MKFGKCHLKLKLSETTKTQTKAVHETPPAKKNLCNFVEDKILFNSMQANILIKL